MKYCKLNILLIVFTCFVITVTTSLPTKQAWAQCSCVQCEEHVTACSGDTCACQSTDDLGQLAIGTLEGGVAEVGEGTLWSLQRDFVLHREWLIKNVWEAHVLPAMMLSTDQITTVAMQQMQVIGSFFDAKHQLETQRLLQDLQAIAHKEYQPSTGMCRFGTTTRSLAAADRNAEFNQIAIAARSTERLLMSERSVGSGSGRDERRSRREQFRQRYCNPLDMGNALVTICENTNTSRINKDINYTHTVEETETLNVNFTDEVVTETETDIMALQANLYGPNLLPIIPRQYLADNDGNVIFKGSNLYMDTRSIAAKRSVAQNSYAAQVGLKSRGAASVLPYMEEILLEMGLPASEIESMTQGNPSYNAQMEMLTKKLYQFPNFYADLYDKPVNVDRKNVSMQAIALMQKRDMYRSQLRSEANTAVILETLLEDLQSYHTNEKQGLTEDTRVLFNLGLGAGAP